LTEGLDFFYDKAQIHPNLVAEAMEKRPIIFFILLVTFLFVFSSAFSLFDRIREADFLSENKYEERDIDTLYAAKRSNLDGLLVPATLFSPIPDILFEFLSSFFSPNTSWIAPFSVLRC
jgi:hypothetical protein